MIRHRIALEIQTAINKLVSAGALPQCVMPDVIVETPKQAGHGDFATNWAMMASKTVAGYEGDFPKNPRNLGEILAAELQKSEMFSQVEVAGPGFINLGLATAVCTGLVTEVLDGSSNYPCPEPPAQRSSINLEYVSVNPNGPITIGSGRGAAYGSALASVLKAAGYGVFEEYYINDGVNSEQMRLFAESVKAICENRPVPENGYKGDYVYETAAAAKEGLPAHINAMVHDFSALSKLDPSDWEVVTSKRLLPIYSSALQAIEAGQGEIPIEVYQHYSQQLMIEFQRSHLLAFGVEFDEWFSEQSLHDSGEVDRCLSQLEANSVADTQPVRTKVKFGKGGSIDEAEKEDQVEGESGGTPTLWLRSTLFGDDQDRVLRRRDGRLTYIASDVAYHKDKFNRGSISGDRADKLITVLGPDHHGYIGRLHAVVAALEKSTKNSVGGDGDRELSEQEARLYGSVEHRNDCQAALAESKRKLEVLIFQLVRFVKDGKPAPMRKRDGNIYALIDLINEIGDKVKPNGSIEEKQLAGKDVARFFYLMRHHDTTFDFDLDLAARQSDENPVFYVQYAHARICSVVDKAESEGLTGNCSAPPSELHERETTLILKIADLPYEIERCAQDYGVNRLTTYAIELARAYHSFYDVCRVIDLADRETSNWRLQVCKATRTALKATLDLIGISAPHRMERETTSAT